MRRNQKDELFFSSRLNKYKSAPVKRFVVEREEEMKVKFAGKWRDMATGMKCSGDKSLHVPVRKIILKQHWLCVLNVEQMLKQRLCLGSALEASHFQQTYD